MFVIITPLVHAQKYNQGVRSVFVLTGINILYNNKNNNKKNKQDGTRKSDNVLTDGGGAK